MAFCSAQLRAIRGQAWGNMTGATAFWAAVAGASLICYALMTRLQNRKRKPRSSGDSAATDAGNYGSDSGGSPADWFGAGHHAATDASGNPVDFGGGDSGGGDGGGGDGGGDGGSSGD